MSSARRTGPFRDLLLTTTALVAALSGGGKDAAAANGLSGFQVQAGSATLSTPSATQSIIRQSSSKAILNWSAFGIPSGSSVQFVQPGAGSIALNRVTGGSASQILGSLSANGQVWLVNPSGVFFGKGAQVDVAGLMATPRISATRTSWPGTTSSGSRETRTRAW
jgi:trimeric autotransporter adhesin